MINEKVLGRLANASFHMFDIKGFENKSISEFVESFRPNQIKCKKWLVEEIANINMNWKNVLVLGSWNGCLLYELMNSYCDVTCWTFLDVNQDCHTHRDLYFEVNAMPKNYSSIIMNAEDFSDHESYDLIINTSCEHMNDIPAVYGPTYALQSNDYTNIIEHINCVNSAKELANKNNLTKTLFTDSQKMPNYTRFMTIGYYR